MADRTGSLVQSSTTGPSGRTIIAFVASYVFSYLLLGLFLVLEQVYAAKVFIDPLSGDISRTFDGPYLIVLTVMFFVPVVFGGIVIGWITGRRSLIPVFLLACLYVATALLPASNHHPIDGSGLSSLAGSTSGSLRLWLIFGYLVGFSFVSAMPTVYLAGRIRNRISPVSQRRVV